MFRALRGHGLALGFGLLVLSPALGVAAPQQPNPAAATVNLDTLGPQVGASLPEFSLRDQDGRERALKSLLGPNGAVIVFYRSADW